MKENSYKSRHGRSYPAREPRQSGAGADPVFRFGTGTGIDDHACDTGTATTTRAEALHAMYLAAEAAEMEEFVEIMGWHAGEPEDIHPAYADEDCPNDCGQDVYDSFSSGVLAETSFFNSASAMLEIAEEMERYPDLSEQVDHRRLAAELSEYLIKSFCELAKVSEFLSDHLVFKLNLFAGYMESDSKSDYFGRGRNVRRAEFFELLRSGERGGAIIPSADAAASRIDAAGMR